jgi:hypothetical protein
MDASASDQHANALPGQTAMADFDSAVENVHGRSVESRKSRAKSFRAATSDALHRDEALMALLTLQADNEGSLEADLDWRITQYESVRDRSTPLMKAVDLVLDDLIKRV